MGILGVKNRTENWKTAQKFAPFFTCESARARLAQLLGEPKSTAGGEVHIELFWKGVRDYIKQSDEVTDQDFACRYNHMFSELRSAIKEFNSSRPPSRQLKLPRSYNYAVCTRDRVGKLYNNLRNTEIDIVLESPSHLFIGEAKDETPLRGIGERVLVHQLIRQYVMTKILLSLRIAEGCSKKKVIPFVVGDKTSLKKSAQVEFMICKGWLKRKNVMSWDKIDELAQAGA